MRLAVVVLALLMLPGLLLGPVSQAQDVPSESEEDQLRRLGLPVQTVVDAVPKVLSLAIQESKFDGSPDQAEAILAQMREFTADFKYGYNPIDGSEAAGVDLEGALRFAVELVDVVESVPARIADVEIISARCSAWGGNVTGPSFERWQERFRNGRAASEATLLALHERVQQLPVVVDPAPLERAVRVLEDWVAQDAVVVQECVSDLEAELVLRGELEPPEDDLGVRFLRVVPGRQYVTGNVTIIGALGVHETAEGIQVVAPELGLDQEVALAQGRRVFSLRHQVPLATELGMHRIEATLPSGAANETDLSVEQAPSRLVLRYPGRMYLERSDRFEVRLESPVRPVTDQALISVEGDLVRDLSLERGQGSFDYRAPGHEVVWNGTISYAGHRVVSEAERPYRINVVLAPPPRQTGFFSFDTDVPTWAWGVAGALAGLVVLDALLRQRRGNRKRTDAGRQDETGDSTLSTVLNALRADRGLVWLYGVYHRFLITTGRASARDTVRSIERRHGKGADVGAIVERSRYGGEPAQDAEDRQASATVVRRWRSWLGGQGPSGRS